MRKNWILGCLLSVSVLSCNGLGLSTCAGQFGGHPQSEQLAAMQHGGAPKPTWTQKITGVFSKKPANPYGSARKPVSGTKLDPISLGFASGPPNAALYLSMAKLSDQGGNTAHARSMYHRALTMEPTNLDGMLALARLEDREGQLDAALHYYNQAVSNHPQSPKALNDLGLCFARRGQLKQSVAPLDQAIRLQPSKQLYRNNIAKVLVELNDVNGALQHLSAVHPPTVAQYNMGVLLHQRGRSQEAVQFLTAASQTDPTFGPARTLLTELSAGTPQVAQNAPTNNDYVLPTPRTTPGQPYPSTGAMTISPAFQTVPSETAQVPLGTSPSLLPPVRQ